MAGMSQKLGEGDPMMEINMTPLIDVMLVLLTLLIITLPIQTHAVKLDMPSPHPTNNPFKPVTVELGIDFDGTILWNGETVNGRNDLKARLRGIAAMADQPELHLRPNKLVKYKVVAMVMAEAQRLGVTKIGLVGNEQFIN